MDALNETVPGKKDKKAAPKKVANENNSVLEATEEEIKAFENAGPTDLFDDADLPDDFSIEEDI